MSSISSNGSGCCCGDVDWSSLDSRRVENSNTWGFANKIGSHTFGDYYYTYHSMYGGTCTKYSVTWKIDPDQREQFRHNIRVLTNILDIVGYIPLLACITGIIRIVAARTLGNMIEKNIENKVYVMDLAKEARRTYEEQITRGIWELIPVIGQIMNLYLDIHWYNVWNERPVGNLTPPAA